MVFFLFIRKAFIKIVYMKKLNANLVTKKIGTKLSKHMEQRQSLNIEDDSAENKEISQTNEKTYTENCSQ